MSRNLNPREKRLLLGCLAVILVTGTLFAFSEFSRRRKALVATITRLEEQDNENDVLLNEREYWQKRMKWLDTKMPYTDSAGRSQGQLLEELQTSALDAELKITGQTLLEPAALNRELKPIPSTSGEQAVCNEVAVNIKLRGDQDKLLRWLLMLQAPEKFQPVKSFEIELDPKAKEKTPQAQCNITVARWFNDVAPDESVIGAQPVTTGP